MKGATVEWHGNSGNRKGSLQSSYICAPGACVKRRHLLLTFCDHHNRVVYVSALGWVFLSHIQLPQGWNVDWRLTIVHSKCLCNIHCMWIGACRLRVQGHAHDAVCMCPPLASPTQYQIMSHSGACLFTIISDSESELSTRKGKKQAFKIAAGVADLAVPAPTTLVCVAAATVAAAGKDTSCDMQYCRLVCRDRRPNVLQVW